MNKIPEPLQAVVDQMAKLPGFGPKSALRAAMALLKWPENETRRMGEAIYNLRDKLSLCSRCGALTDTEPCAICRDVTREKSSLCVVSEWDSMLTLERGAFYRGYYLILGGLIAPLDNMNPEHLDLDKLDSRLAEGDITEVILGLGATIEAENTASYVKERIIRRFPHVKVTRLAQGIPLGSEVKFMDSETLRQSMKYRQDL
ncbi:recombination mediator RecR [Desulfovibrio sp. OttesenSCG-928-F07]|nr:recombination mediator RecR [Desulfovibrio sp. OttesenSCG-928-F07]